MLCAAGSAFSRAGLNIIDRYQIGVKSLSIAALNFLNNAVPAGIILAIALIFGVYDDLLRSFINWRTALFSGSVQLVAYAFSFGFRNMTVSQVTVAGKAADLFIPIGIFLSTDYWDWTTYIFAVLTTLVCLPILHTGATAKRTPQSRKAVAQACFVIGVALLLQATFAPVLIDPGVNALAFKDAFVFTASVIMWRTIWSLLPIVRYGTQLGKIPRSILIHPVFGARVVLTLTTQVSFVLAVGSSFAALAWPILNSTGLLAMVLSSLCLGEKPSRKEGIIIIAIAFLALLRFFLV